MNIVNKIKQLIKPKYESLNKIEINKDSILSNYKLLQAEQPGVAIFPVLKSNAYGHGLKELCLILNESEASMVIVDSFPEAQIAYKYFKKKVLILGEMPLKAYAYCSLRKTEFCVYSRESLEILASLGRAKIHLFVNSGMNREGIKDLESFLVQNRDLLNKVDVVGLCSHLASAEDDNNISNSKQVEKFLHDLTILKSNGFNPKWVHLGNSAAIFSLKNKELTAFRSGIALYGYNPFSQESNFFIKADNLTPALRLTSTIVSTQDLSIGDQVSYNGTYVADNKKKVAVIPFGYYEGLPRSLSNKGELASIKNNNKEYLKIAGRICMNLTCLEGHDSLKVGDLVEIVSINKKDKNSLNNLASLANMISYEFLVGLQSNIRKVIINK
jgi:alanine racemase